MGAGYVGVWINLIKNVLNMLQISLRNCNEVLGIFKNSVFGKVFHCVFWNDLEFKIRKIFMQGICTKDWLYLWLVPKMLCLVSCSFIIRYPLPVELLEKLVLSDLWYKLVSLGCSYWKVNYYYFCVLVQLW